MPDGEILLIEDEELQSKLYADLFASLGRPIRTASGVKAALKLIEDHPPALVLIDIMMPEVDGFEGCVLVRNSVGPDVPIIFLSVLDDRQTVFQGFDAGGNDHISKQNSLGDIVKKIDVWLALPTDKIGSQTERSRAAWEKIWL